MNQREEICVRWTQPGFHCWADAQKITGDRRGYLSSRHRHLFYYEASVVVQHDDREIEFHDLLESLSSFTALRNEHGSRSCEMLAKEVLDFMDNTFGTDNRIRWVSVFEDNECGATVRRKP